MSRWHLHTRTKKPTAQEQTALRRTQALVNCQHGKHTLSPTFRPGERICTIGGVVFYCPACLEHAHLTPSTNKQTFVFACSLHRDAEVQA